MASRIGNYTLRLQRPLSIIGYAAVGSRKEAQGPLGQYFDYINDDSSFGEKTWEKAESALQKCAVNKAIKKAGITPGDIDMMFAGDLLNQCIGSTYGARQMGIPYMGLYGACSTMAESLILAALITESGMASRCLAATSSHFCSAERQFRFPLEYGGVRTPSAQWTVTGAGACITALQSGPPYIHEVTIGTIEDYGITDINNMGAAMAPAACSTLTHYFHDSGKSPDDFDLILSGDLGMVGSELLHQLMDEAKLSITDRHKDCGLLIYDRLRQDVHSGGSGCGCSASVLCAYILPQLQDGRLNDVLFLATGAMMSPTSVQQGESIPGIAHLLHLSHKPLSDHTKKEGTQPC